MWIFLPCGFYSVVAFQVGGVVNPNKLLVRARCKEHLTALKTQYPGFFTHENGRIFQTQQNDYRWRMVVEKTRWAKLISIQVRNTDYTNFKDAAKALGDVKDPTAQAYNRFLLGVWCEGNTFQQKLTPRPPFQGQD